MTQMTKRALAASLKKLLSQKTLDKITVIKDIYDLIDCFYTHEASRALDGKKLTELKQPLLLKSAEQGALKKASGTVVGELLAKYGIV